MENNIVRYLIVKSISPVIYINQGYDPVTGDDIFSKIEGSMEIIDSRKTLKSAISIRDKKYKNCLIIPSY